MKNFATRPLLTLLAAAGLAVGSAGVTAQSAQNRPQVQPPASTTASTQQAAAAGRDVRATRLLDMDIHNAKGESLGEIHDVIVDMNNERVQYAVVEFGGFLGLGEKLFAYPMSAFSMGKEGDELVLNVDRQTLEKAPGFERNRWPNWNDANFRGQIDRFPGAAGTRASAPAANAQLVRVSELIGRDVDDARGQEVGEIEDVVVNLGDGRVRYVVMEFDRAWNPDDKLIAVPVATITPLRDDDEAVISLSREQINTNRGFDERAWPDVNDPAFRRDIDAQLNAYGNVRK